MSSREREPDTERTIKLSRVTLWRRPDLRTTTVLNTPYHRTAGEDGPEIVKVELSQDDKEQVTDADEHIVVVELAEAPSEWPVHDSIAWEGEWDGRGLLADVLEAVQCAVPADLAPISALSHESAGDALQLPTDLRLLYGSTGHGDDWVLYKLYKGMASRTLAVVWPGNDAVLWNLSAGTTAQDDETRAATTYVHWSELEDMWRLVPEDERDGRHAIHCLDVALAASCTKVPAALRAAVERAEGRLQAALDENQPEGRSELPSITAPVLRTGGMIAAAEGRLSDIASSVAGTAVETRVASVLRDVRDLRAEARQLVDIIGSVFAARHLELAEQRARSEADSLKRDMALQRYAASLGVVILVPTLITGIFGANVALPYQDRSAGLAVMLLAAIATASVGLGLVRWRFPAEAANDDARGSVPWVLYGVGAIAAAVATLLTVLAAAGGSIGAPSTTGRAGVTDPKLASQTRAIEQQDAVVIRQQLTIEKQLQALRRTIRIRFRGR